VQQKGPTWPSAPRVRDRGPNLIGSQSINKDSPGGGGVTPRRNAGDEGGQRGTDAHIETPPFEQIREGGLFPGFQTSG